MNTVNNTNVTVFVVLLHGSAGTFSYSFVKKVFYTLEDAAAYVESKKESLVFNSECKEKFIINSSEVQ